MSTLLKYFSSILTRQERPESPIPDAFPPPIGPQPRWIDCGNMACIEYISDPNSIISYQYLWDFITMPSMLTSDGCCGLFPDGLNLIILKEPDDDVVF